MNYLIAPDSFKGTLTSRQAADAISEGIRSADPKAAIRCLPMADGGEGTLDVLESALQPEGVVRKAFNFTKTSNPSPSSQFTVDQSKFEYLVCDIKSRQGTQRTAFIESAQCIGMHAPGMQKIDIMQRGSSVIGSAMRELLESGFRHIVIGLGGTATHDGGLGMLMALGARATDAYGQSVSPDLNGLLQLSRVDLGEVLLDDSSARITVLCDVDSMLLGESGSTRMFSAQKGLNPAMHEQVDRAMACYADLCERSINVHAQAKPGSGAAGGLGFALALLGGKLISGANYVMQVSGINQALHWADWLVTGEGRSDAQTLLGKIPFKLAVAARHAGKKTALVSGQIPSVSGPARDGLANYFDRMIAVYPDGHMPGPDIHKACSDLRTAAAKLLL